MNSDVVVLGDFNVDCQPGTAGKGNTLKRKVHSFMCSLDLIQLIKEPTRITDTSKTLIDLIFVLINIALSRVALSSCQLAIIHWFIVF